MRIFQLQNSNHLTIDITGVKILKTLYPESNEKSNMATIYDRLLIPQGNIESEENLENISNNKNLCADSSNWNSFVYEEKGAIGTIDKLSKGKDCIYATKNGYCKINIITS